MSTADAVRHVVVVMLENRSFDNVLGYLYTPGDPPRHHRPAPQDGQPPFRGLAFTDTGLLANSLQRHGKVVASQAPAPGARATNVPGYDPGEEYEHVNRQLFGDPATPAPGAPPSMRGFLQDYADTNKEASVDTARQIMHSYTPADLPVLNGLARGFAVSDEWYASVPTQTNANRAFSICGTSLGLVDNGYLSQGICPTLFVEDQFETDTVWNVLSRNGRGSQDDWLIFWHTAYPPKICGNHNGLPYTWNLFPAVGRLAGARAHFLGIDEFYDRAKRGRLPAFSYIEPQWGGAISKVSILGNEYHPPSDVTPGEHLLVRIYESLRANPAAWAHTVLAVTFDEHGGTYDHVGPPWGATPPAIPTPKPPQHDFGFDRFGVRVPALLVSPLIEEGTVFRSPTAVPFDHTSLIASVLEWMLPEVGRSEWGLGDRAKAAPTFWHAVTRTDARTDNPLAPGPPPPTGTPLDFGDPFVLRHESGDHVSSAADWKVYYFPTLGSGARVPLQFRGGWGRVADGATVQIWTPEYLEPLDWNVRFAGWYAGIRNVLGAWADSKDCYYFSSNDEADFQQQYWTVQRVGGAASGPIRYGDRVRLVSRYYAGQNLARDQRWLWSNYITTSKSATDTWTIETTA